MLQGGGSEFFTLNVANTGPFAATAVTVTDTLTNPPVASVSGVSTTPGATALSRTPDGPSSAASARIICSVPALVAA